MPKIFEYFGLVIFFYSNEHEPIHVHASNAEFECKKIKMKIKEEIAGYDTRTIRIIRVDYVKDFTLHIYFSNGSQQTIDFEPFLAKNKHPDIQKYYDIERFKSFSIANGNLIWNDYEMIFPIKDLLDNNI